MSELSEKVLLLKLLCMADNELIHFFQTNYTSSLPNEFHYRWRKRLSIYSTSSSSSVTHEHKWLVDALRHHEKDEISLLRDEIISLLDQYKEEEIKEIKNGENKKEENTENEKKYVKKTQSCPSFSHSHFSYLHLHDALEKTVNGC